LREDDPESLKSWDAKLAKKYEDSLFKEFAVCDLKHYKSGNIALRWRTEDEVLSGAGETTCGNTRCAYHESSLDEDERSGSSKGVVPPPKPKLSTVELPFAYVEQGETTPREVLVKVVLCSRCLKKLTWKREQEKKATMANTVNALTSQEAESSRKGPAQDDSHREERRNREHHSKRERACYRPRSRSRSPKRRR